MSIPVWPPGDGEMARLIREFEWASTPLGPVSHWPQSLKTIVDLMLASPSMMSLVWGAEAIHLYNDSFTELLQEHRTLALGRSAYETFARSRNVFEADIAAGMAGKSARLAAQRYPVLRQGHLEDAWFDVDYAPIHDEAGVVAGVLWTLKETTAQHVAEQALRASETRQMFLLQLSDALRPLREPTEIQATATRLLGEYLGASRVAYVEVSGDEYIILSDYTNGIPSMAGRYSVTSFGPGKLAEYRTGRTRVVRDTVADPHNAAPDTVNFTAVSIRAGIGVPLVKDGVFVSNFVVHMNAPRNWTLAEVALVEDTAERTWAAVERARAEAALRESEKRYRTLFETMGHGFALVQLVRDAFGRVVDQRYLELNPAYERMLGIPVAQALGRLASEVFPNIEPWWSERFDRILAVGKPERIERLFHVTGQWFEVYVHPVGDDRFVALYEDITARKQTEAALRESEARLALAFKTLPVGIAVVDVAGETVMANDEMRRFLPTGRIPSRDLACSAARWRGWNADGEIARLEDFPTARALRGETVSLGMQMLYRDDNGAEIWTEVLSTPLRDGDKQISGAISVVVDVDRAKRSEERLRESETALAADLAGTTLLRDLAERLVTEENTETIYGEILSAAMLLTQADAGTVQIFDPGTKSLVLLATRNFAPKMTDRFRRVDAGSNTACGMALRSGRRTFADFDEADPDEECRLHAEAGYRSAQTTPLLSRSGQPLGMLSTHWRASGHRPNERELRFLDLLARQAADLIEQREAQRVLRASEARFRGFADASADVLWIADARGERLDYLSPAFEQVFGAPRQAALADLSVVLGLVHPEDRAVFLSGMPRALAGETAIVHYRVVHPRDGRVVYLRDTGFPIRDERGAIVQVAGVVQDISDIEAARIALEAEKERFRTLAEGIPQLVWRSCAEGRWTWASPQWLDYTGQSQQETHGLGWLDVVHPDDHEATQQAWHEGVLHGRLSVEFRVRRASDGGWRWHQTRSVPVRDASGPDGMEGLILEWLGTTTDIEDLKRLQGQQQVLVAELQHRTRNLLAVVRNVARRSIDPSAGRDLYDARLSALGRVQGFLSRSTAYSVLLAEVVEAELLAASDGTSDRVTVNGPVVELPGESVQAVALALHELATNAVKYGAIAQPSGRLSVTWRVEASDNGRQLVIDWHESGVTMPEGPPTRRGYGTELITQALPYQLGAETALEFTADGVKCRVVLPNSAFTDPSKEEPA